MEDVNGNQRSDGSKAEKPTATGFAISAVLLAIALVGAVSAGVLSTVGPYLLGVSGLVAVLFVVGRR